MFRCQDIALRKEYVELVENVRDSGGDVKIFSSLHVSGERKFYANNIHLKLAKYKHIYCVLMHVNYVLKQNYDFVFRIRSINWGSSFITFSYAGAGRRKQW